MEVAGNRCFFLTLMFPPPSLSSHPPLPLSLKSVNIYPRVGIKKKALSPLNKLDGAQLFLLLLIVAEGKVFTNVWPVYPSQGRSDRLFGERRVFLDKLRCEVTCFVILQTVSLRLWQSSQRV